MSERYEYAIKAFTDMEAELAQAGIEVSNEVVATLLVTDELHSLYCDIEYRGI